MRPFLYPWITISIAFSGLVAGLARAANIQDASEALQEAGAQSYGDDAVDAASREGYLPALIGGIIQIALLVVGGAFLLLLIYGGYNWMIARGDAEKVKKAKEIITNALIGLVIVFTAYAVSAFVVSRIVAATQLQLP